MDTREKIVSLADISGRLGDKNWVAVAGTFDPLTLQQAERLSKIAEQSRPMIAVVDPAPNALLSAAARAALVAALRCVAIVVVADAHEFRKVTNLEIVQDPALDEKLSEAFAEHVRSRQDSK